MMNRYILTAFLAFSVFLGAITPTDIYAQSNSPQKSAGRKKDKPEPKKGLLNRTMYNTMFFHDPSDPENIFYLRIESPGEVSGCFRITRPKYEIKNSGQYINLKFTDQEIFLKKRQPRYTNYDCKHKKAMAIIDVQFDRDQLIKDGIKKISVNSDKYGRFTDVIIKVSKEKIELTPDGAEGADIDILWFYPENTIVLHAPQGKMGDTKIRDAIREFGISQGFTPMEEALNGYDQPWDAYNYVVFVDQDGAVRQQLKNPRDHLPIGHIEPTRTVHGPEGLYEEPYEVEVFAGIPGHEIVVRNSYRRKYD